MGLGEDSAGVLVQQDGNIVLLPEMALLTVSTADTCLAHFPFPEPIVIKQFHPKEGAEKVLSCCSINSPHLPYSYKHFPPPTPCFVHRVHFKPTYI
jgi:hypothetical protein